MTQEKTVVLVVTGIIAVLLALTLARSRGAPGNPAYTVRAARPDGDEGFVRSGGGRRDHQGGPATGGRTWVVRRGDTFDGIARRIFGDASLAGEIARANPDVDPRRLRPGTTIRIPALRGRRAGGDGGVRPEGRVHRVRRGDRLQTIARRYYGSTSAWPRIYEANRDVLAHPDRLRPGMRLRIP